MHPWLRGCRSPRPQPDMLYRSVLQAACARTTSFPVLSLADPLQRYHGHNRAGHVRQENFLDAHGLRGFIRAIFAVDQPGSKPEKILSARRQYAKQGDETYLVGDAASDIRAARDASVKSIGVSWGHQSLEKLTDAKPDYLVHSPRELLELLDK